MPATSTPTNWDETDSFFEFSDAARLTLTPPSTLRRWIAGEVVTPSRVATTDDGREVKGFSLRDLAYIRIVRHLTAPVFGYGLRLEVAVTHVTHALDRLAPVGTHWADAHLLVGPEPFMYIPDDAGVTKSLSRGAGQRVFEDMMDVRVRQMLLGPESLLIPADLLAHIEMNPRKQGGHPVIRGTNITTEMAFSIIVEDGMEQAQRLYPFVTGEAFLAVRKFHKEYLHERVEVPIG